MIDPAPTANEFFGTDTTQQPQPNALENVGNVIEHSLAPNAPNAFGPKPLPSSDEFFNPEKSPLDITLGAISPISSNAERSEAVNQFFDKTAVGRVATQFAAGVAGPLVFGTPEVDDTMKKLGIYNDLSKGQYSLLKGFNEALIRPAANVLNAFLSGPGAAIGQASREAGEPLLGEFLMGESGTGTFPHIPEPIAEAKSNGVLDSEGVFMGTSARTPEQIEQAKVAELSLPYNIMSSHGLIRPENRLLDYKDILENNGTPETQAALINEIRAQSGGPQAHVTPEQVTRAYNYLKNEPESEQTNITWEKSPPIGRPTLDEMSRNIAPEAFNNFDRLTAQKEQLSQQLTEQKSSEAKPIQEKIDTILGKVNGVEGRLTKVRAAQLEDLRSQLQDVHLQDSPEANAIRLKRVEVTNDLGNLAPEINQARKRASEFLPPEDIIEPEKPVEENKPQEDMTPESTIENPGVGRETQKIPEVNIADDVSKKLIAAGRPEEEANASAKIWHWYYDTLAKDLGGQKTAEQLYQEDNFDAKNVSRKNNELAQGDVAVKGRQGSYNLTTGIVKFFKHADASTFMHETAHKWLDDIMHYDAQPGANDIIKQRAATVRSWLGMREGGDISTAQHERFARSFERYISEGIAPNRELAGVFQKFKQWLSGLVTAAKRSKFDISDDIRGVFDRLLSTNPEKTIISPEEEPGGPIARVHTIDAETTPPEQAAGVRDDIRDEINITSRKSQEITDALKQAESGARTESIPGEATSGSGVGTTPGAGQGQPGPTTEPGKVSTGGGAFESEGNGIPEQPDSAEKPERPANLAPERPTGSAAITKWTDTDFLDKAGNIRTDLLTTSADDRAAIVQLARANNNFGYVRGGVITDQMVADMANDLNIKGSDVNVEKLRQMAIEDGIPLAARVRAVRDLLNQVNKDAQEAALKVRDEGSDEAIANLVTIRNRFLRVAETVSAVTAEQGRALRAFRDISKEDIKSSSATEELFQTMTGATKQDFIRMAHEMEKLDTNQKVSGFLRDSLKPDFWDKLIEYRNNNLLSGPVTHFFYTVGGMINALYKPIIQIPSAVASQAFRENVLGETIKNRIYLGESGEMLHAMTQGSIDGWKAATSSWKTGRSVTLPFQGPNIESLERPQRAIGGTLGKVINTPVRVINSIHGFQKVLQYEQNIAALAYRSALDKGLEENSPAFIKHVANAKLYPSDEMMQQATKQAIPDIYMQKINSETFMGRMVNAMTTTKLGRLMFPFVKMTLNIKKTALMDNFVLGALDKDIRANLAGVNGDVAKDMQIGKIAAGSAVAGAGFALSVSGMSNGSGPSDSSQYRIWRLTHVPNSVQIGNIVIPHKMLGIPGELLNITANMADSAHGLGEHDMGKIAAGFISGAGRSFFDTGFTRQMSDTLDAILHHDQYGAHFVQGIATQLSPFSVGLGQTTNIIDPFERNVRSQGMSNFYGIWDALKAKIPGVDTTLEQKRDFFGEPINRSSNYDLYRNNPVVQRMNSLNMGIGTLSHKIRGVDLTDQQYDDYARVAGRFTKMRLSALVQPGFERLPPAVQIKSITGIIDNSREMAAKFVMMQNPGIMQKALKNKQFIQQ